MIGRNLRDYAFRGAQFPRWVGSAGQRKPCFDHPKADVFDGLAKSDDYPLKGLRLELEAVQRLPRLARSLFLASEHQFGCHSSRGKLLGR
jgi:hypothetical protein